MSESDTALHDEEVFSDELPDAVLEVAGSGAREFRYDWILLRARDLPHEAGARRPSCSVRREGLRATSPSCRSCCGSGSLIAEKGPRRALHYRRGPRFCRKESRWRSTQYLILDGKPRVLSWKSHSLSGGCRL